MKIAYLDCFSGVSGDMFVGSLLDAGLSFEKLKRDISGLNLDGYKISAKKEERNSIFGTRFSVFLQKTDQEVRYLKEIKEILKGSDLPLSVIERCTLIFEKLAAAEGEIHHISPDEVNFHIYHRYGSSSCRDSSFGYREVLRLMDSCRDRDYARCPRKDPSSNARNYITSEGYPYLL
jgi:uncharacterized protein (DUF111 family)